MFPFDDVIMDNDKGAVTLSRGGSQQSKCHKIQSPTENTKPNAAWPKSIGFMFMVVSMTVQNLTYIKYLTDMKWETAED